MPPWHGEGGPPLGKAGKIARWEMRQAAERRQEQAAQLPPHSGVWSVEEEEEQGSAAAKGGAAARELVARVNVADVPNLSYVFCYAMRKIETIGIRRVNEKPPYLS